MPPRRSLLIGVTAVSLVFAAVAREVASWQYSNNIVRCVVDKGGEANKEWLMPNWLWQSKVPFKVGLQRYFYRVDYIRLQSAEVTNDFEKRLSRLHDRPTLCVVADRSKSGYALPASLSSSLSGLEIENCQDSADLLSLFPPSDCKITRLVIRRSVVDPNFVGVVQNWKLESLELSEVTISGRDLVTLCKIEGLKEFKSDGFDRKTWKEAEALGMSELLERFNK